jgi:fucose permease
MKPNYQHTLNACFVGYIVQAIVNNFTPLLFLTFQSEYGIPLEKITMLVTINFGLQLLIDFLSAGLIDRIGYRASALAAHGLAAAGLILLTVLPGLLPDPFTGLLLSVLVYAVGGGLLEVLVSPMVEACPTENKAKTMSLLHSFYCWGQVGVVLFSTLFFRLFGTGRWRIMAAIWAVIPIANAFVFAKVPIATLNEEGEPGSAMKGIARKKIFWILMLLMLCAGACEQAVSQWASTFAEKGLGVDKTIGDLAGPMMFAAMMGLARTVYGKYGERIDLNRFMLFSGILCAASYLLISLSPLPFLGLLGCGLCGLSVGILWPGTYSMASAAIRGGGTAMFAFLALAGDLGCSGGPTFVGLVSGASGDNLKAGMLAAVLFPAALIFGIVWEHRTERRAAA